MSYKKDLLELDRVLTKLDADSNYDVNKFSFSILHLATQLEYFYTTLVPLGTNDEKTTVYKIVNRPREHTLAYFNIGRGFPKELMDGHWCYVLKDFGYKMLVIPSTSIKDTFELCNPCFEYDIELIGNDKIKKSRLQLSDMRGVDMQRLDLRKPIIDVNTSRDKIVEFVLKNLF